MSELTQDELDNTETVKVPTLSQSQFEHFRQINSHVKVCTLLSKNEIEVSVGEQVYTDSLQSITMLTPLSTIDKLNKGLLLLDIINSPSSFIVRSMASLPGRQVAEVIRQVANWNVAAGNPGVVMGEQTRYQISPVALPPAGAHRSPDCSYMAIATYLGIPVSVRKKKTCPQVPQFIVECRSYAPGTNNTQPSQRAKAEMFISAGVQTVLLIDGPACECRYYCAAPAAGAAPLIPGAVVLGHNPQISCLSVPWGPVAAGAVFAPAINIVCVGSVAAIPIKTGLRQLQSSHSTSHTNECLSQFFLHRVAALQVSILSSRH